MPVTDSNDNCLGDLLRKYFTNSCTREEMNLMFIMLENEKNTEGLTELLKDFWEKSKSGNDTQETNLENKFSLLMAEAKGEIPGIHTVPAIKRRRWKLYSSAAAIIICVFLAAAYYLFKKEPVKLTTKTEYIKNNKNDVAPGENKAVLTLADGTSIILDSTQNGALTTQGNAKIVKLNGTVSYRSLKNKTSEIVYNTISTPRGGEYQLMLADGTKVWLNAASSLRYPSGFAGKERKVELTGEAYFEVAKNVEMPFKVKVGGMGVEVLGTHFNINSYMDEPVIRTTLLEGSIKISQSNHTSGFLKPGQQARLDRNGKINIINDTNVEDAVAWKEGKFQFDRADIRDVMRQLARWYNVEIEYKGPVSSHFVGTISRDENLSAVLNMLRLTGEVKFLVEDKRVIVMPSVKEDNVNKNEDNVNKN